MPAPNALIVELKDLFAANFSLDELADFAQELGVNLEDISGTTRKAKAREFTTYLDRHDLISEVAIIGPQERPDIPWAAVLGRYGIVAGPVVDVTAPAVEYTDLQRLQTILAARPMFMTPEGRATTLSLAGVAGLITVDLNGNGQLVAGSVLDQLNRYGEIVPGDTALGRLLNYLRQDPALPPDQKLVVDDVIERYALMTSPD